MTQPHGCGCRNDAKTTSERQSDLNGSSDDEMKAPGYPCSATDVNTLESRESAGE